MKQMVLLILLACAPLLQNGSAARILGVFAHPTRSNSLFTHAVMSTLAAAGHDVTVYGPFKPNSKAGFHHVEVVTDFHKTLAKTMDYEYFMKTFSNTGFGCSLLASVAHTKSESFLKHPTVQELLHSNETFDLVVTGALLGEESVLVFGHKFNAPVISLLPMNTWSSTDFITGNAISLAYSPEYFAYPFTDKMSLFQRIQNVLSGTVCLLRYNFYQIPEHDNIVRRQTSFLSPPPPPVNQMVRNMSLTFINVHPVVSYPKPFSPNVVLVGGIHIESNMQSLPKDIQEVMDNAEEGVIFCSLGSIVPVDSMPRHLIHAYINAFKKLPQKVIWKISATHLPELPKNIFVSSWLPQQRILEHPNLRLFFTHGGLGSQLEALKAGVPVVGLPFFSDQPYNVRLFEYLGVGVGLSQDTLSEATISAALQTVLNDTRYVENAKRLARIYADQPMQPAELVVYWTNYVLKHGGSYLRPQAATMSWYQRGLLDVAMFVLLIVTIVITIIYKLTIGICRSISKPKTSKLKYS